MYINDTIGAIATAPGMGGVGIIRVSGKDSFTIVNEIFKGPSTTPLNERPNRTIHYGHIVDPEGNKKIDEVIVLLMKGPHSYTAEDVVEIQCHGGFVALRSILSLLYRLGVRPAEEGEFTKRAFLNGRIDLTQAEAIIDIIEAKSEASLSVAVNQLDGTVSKLIYDLREKLITMIAHLEVTIDYPEEDIEELSAREVDNQLIPILENMDALLKTAQSGKMIRDGVVATIIGRPNAGKSSLMNALLRENRAIVTDIPGTTRDSIEEFMNIEGIPLRLVDTAGIRETDDVVEALGVEKAKEYLLKADMVFVVIDGSTPMTDEEKDILRSASHRPSIVFINKSDQGEIISKEDIEKIGTFTHIAHITASEGEGLDIVRQVVTDLVYGGNVQANHAMMLSNMRHIELMKQAYDVLVESREAIHNAMPIDFVVTDIRSAWELLGEITGQSLRESMVDELFKRFCLGK